MTSYEAFQKAINGNTIEHAKNLGLSTSAVYKWQEPHTDFTDSGAYNPLDRVERIIEKSLALGVVPDKALAPIHYLAERFNLIVIPAPKVSGSLHEIHKELSRVTKEFGDVLSVTGARLSDGDMSARDAEVITKEAYQLQRTVAAFIACIDRAKG